MRDDTASARHRLYLLARVVVARHYRQELTLELVAGALASSPRQLQRAYAQFGEGTFREDLLARRMSVAADLLIDQPSISVANVGRLVGYRQGAHFAVAFKRRYGLAPARFRQAALQRANQRRDSPGSPATTASAAPSCSSSSTRSAPGSVRRISVPPPGAGSAAMLPSC